MPRANDDDRHYGDRDGAPELRPQGTGDPNTRYEERSYDELQNLARKRRLNGYSDLNKEELIRALRC